MNKVRILGGIHFLCIAALAAMPLHTEMALGQGLVPEKDYSLRLSVEGTVTYDSNARLAVEEEKEKADTYGELKLNLGFSKRIGPGDLSLDGTIFTRGYADQSDLNHLGGSWTIGYTDLDPDGARFRFRQKYQHVEDYALQDTGNGGTAGYEDSLLVAEDRSSRAKRDIVGVGLTAVVMDTAKTEADLGYMFNATLYDSDELYDLKEHQAEGDIGWKVTDKSQLFVQGQYGVQDAGSLANLAEYYRARLGWKTRVTGKSSFSGSAGIQLHDDGSNESETGSDPCQQNFSFQLAGTWRPTPKLQVVLGGHNEIQPSVVDVGNTRRITTASLGVGQSLGRGFGLSYAATYRTEEYRYTTDGLPRAREVDSVAGRIGATYAPLGRSYSFFVDASVEQDDSNIDGEDFVQTRVTAGIRLTPRCN